MMLRISALAIALVTAAGLYKKAWLPAKKCIRAGFFVYYTHLSNLLVLAYQLALGIAGHDPSCGVFRWLSAPVTALSVTLCIYVTHLLYAFVLIPAAKRSGSSWQARSAKRRPILFSSSTNPPSGCTRWTCGFCSASFRRFWTMARRSLSLNMIWM